MEGHDRCVRLLITAGTDVNTVNGAGGTALMLACEKGHEAVVLLLLEAGAELDKSAHGRRERRGFGGKRPK